MLARMPPDASGLTDDPLWYKDAIIYELHVRTFYDSDGDGVGDFLGLTQRLDYLQDLGVTALWLLPFCPSPLKDDGYDTSDFTGVHATYGTMRDFKTFLREAHRRGLRVIIELVLNHTSDQHAWFRRARQAKPGNHWRKFYVWSDTPEKYREARIIFKDFEPSNWTWDPVAQAHYWHRFYAHQPDLNYDHPEVRRTMLRVVDFWLELGVDGLPGCRALSLRARGNELREPPGNPRVPQGAPGSRRRALPEPDAPGRGQPVAGGCQRLFRRRGRMSHGLPLPPHATVVHGHPARGSLPHHRHRPADALDSRDLPVGPVSAKPRRADAGDGHRRGPRLHVPAVRDRPAGSREPRDPPAAGAAPGKRPQDDRAHEQPAVLAPGHPSPLLRRRDRHGGQLLPGGSERCADPNAVECGP